MGDVADKEAATARKILSCIAAYVVVGLLTFGYNINHSKLPDDCTTLCAWEQNNINMSAVVSGVGWPVYWAGTAAIWVTRWP